MDEQELLTSFVFFSGYSVLEYELLNLQIPTINIVGALVKSGIRVLVYRYFERLIRFSV